ncbi:Mov34/MPN/PAD-1 family protein [Paraglaciecola mesophila]|uniref:Mov34/MPN/PAD-1 family protein n=1 Tax=Paraglaciecola mesophila TaxID=197222 RepID=A0ABU9SV06_9ALTE
MIRFRNQKLDLEILFSSEVIANMQCFRQTCLKKEAGGLLFTNSFENNTIEIKFCSTPNKHDLRSRLGFYPHKQEAQCLINKKFNEGLYYVGDWHTHPQKIPVPSSKDKRTIKDIFVKSEHHLSYLILIILSSDKYFSNSYVAMADQNNIYDFNYFIS